MAGGIAAMQLGVACQTLANTFKMAGPSGKLIASGVALGEANFAMQSMALARAIDSGDNWKIAATAVDMAGTGITVAASALGTLPLPPAAKLTFNGLSMASGLLAAGLASHEEIAGFSWAFLQKASNWLNGDAGIGGQEAADGIGSLETAPSATPRDTATLSEGWLGSDAAAARIQAAALANETLGILPLPKGEDEDAQAPQADSLGSQGSTQEPAEEALLANTGLSTASLAELADALSEAFGDSLHFGDLPALPDAGQEWEDDFPADFPNAANGPAGSLAHADACCLPGSLLPDTAGLAGWLEPDEAGPAGLEDFAWQWQPEGGL
jgi:hypothetical protein